MKRKVIHEENVPYFAWDRSSTAGSIRQQLKQASGFEWSRLAAWIMREAAFGDVWQFLDPKEVRDHFSELEPLLGRKRSFWRYILAVWHELGRI